MVRLLTLEEKVRRQPKQITFAVRGVVQLLEVGGGVFEEPARARGIQSRIRVIVRAKSKIPEAWAMSVLFDNKRIDCLDWERVVKDHRGKACSGWHRHVWKNGDCEKHKECLPLFKPSSIEHFIVEGFKLFNVKLGRSVRDDRQLQLDQAGAI